MKLIKFWKILVVMASVLIILVGCSEADKVNTNISKQADYFECERKITVYNARTDLVILECEGYLALSNNSNNELVVTVKHDRACDLQEKLHLSQRLHHVCGGGYYGHPHGSISLQAIFPHAASAAR